MPSNVDNKGTSAASLREGDIRCINKVMLSRWLQWCLGYWLIIDFEASHCGSEGRCPQPDPD
jgi:hypothetical protein